VNHLDHDRFDATLFTFEAAADLAGAVDRARVRLVGELRRSRFDTRPIEHLARIIRDEEVELVHCTLQMALLVAHGAIVRSGRSLPLIEAIHTTKNRGRRQELADRLLYVPLMKGCDRVITVCEAQRRFWASKYPMLGSKMITVYNGIDLEKYRDDVPPAEKAELRSRLRLEDGDLVVGLVAAIRPEKNHEGVLEAAARLAKLGHRVKFLFAGGAVDERDEARLVARTRELGLEPHIRWMGSLLDPRPMISILDAAILFSTTESFPLSLLECLAMGKPVVSSDVGGVPEIVDHEKNGLLVPAGDLGAFTAALARLAANRAYLRELASNARPSIEARFSVNQMVRKTEEVMAQVLDARWNRPALGGPRSRFARQEETRRRA
jgi:glycosyltransferase involved in cell wall biosynthesis